MRIVAIICLAFCLGACSAAGPFVTHVEPLEGGALRVRRCMIEHRWAPVGDSVKESECTSTVVRPPAQPSRVIVVGKGGAT